MDRIFISSDYHLWNKKNDAQHPERSKNTLESLKVHLPEEMTTDDCWIYLGDLCDPEVADEKWLRELIMSVPARRILCRGNNDTASANWYHDLGFDDVVDVVRVHNILFSHKPIRVAPDELNIHGHLHGEIWSQLGYKYITVYDDNLAEHHPVTLDDILRDAAPPLTRDPDYSMWDKNPDNPLYAAVDDGTRADSILDLSKEFVLVPVDEACKNVTEARKFVYGVDKLARKYDANYFVVTDGASGIHNSGNAAVKAARDAHVKWELANGGNPYEDWSAELSETTYDIMDEVVFPDIDSTRYFESNDEHHKRKAEKAEKEDSSVVAVDENAGYFKKHRGPNGLESVIFDPLIVKPLCDLNESIRELAIELSEASSEMSYSSSQEVVNGIPVKDKESLTVKNGRKKPVKIVRDNLSESTFADVKRVIGTLSSDERKFLYHGGSFVDSPNVIYRNVSRTDQPGSTGGFVEVYRFNDDPSTGVMVLAVSPHDRGTGLSDSLISNSINPLSGMGVKRIFCRVVNGNTHSADMLERNEFAKIGSDNHYTKYARDIEHLVSETVNPHSYGTPREYAYERFKDIPDDLMDEAGILNPTSSIVGREIKDQMCIYSLDALSESAKSNKKGSPKKFSMDGQGSGHSNPLDDREKRETIADKYGLRDVGNTHEEDEYEETDIERRRKERMKNLRKANRVRRWKRFKCRIKRFFTGKNESVANVDDDGTWIDHSHEEEDYLVGVKEPFFEHPDRYKDADTNLEGAVITMEDNVIFNDRINEAVTSKKLKPVYVVLIHSGTKLATAIKTLTGAQYTHASISFDPSLEHMYSFGAFEDKSRGRFANGFKMENFRSPWFQSRDISYAVYMVPCTETEYEMMERRLSYFIRNDTKFRFNKLGLLKNFLGIFDNPQYRFFCSQFVADILHAGRPESDFLENPGKLRPIDFTKFEDAIFVHGGEDMRLYDSKVVIEKTTKLLRAAEMKRKMYNEGAIMDINADNPWAAEILDYQLRTMDESECADFMEYVSLMKRRDGADGRIVFGPHDIDVAWEHYLKVKRSIETAAKNGDITGVKACLRMLDSIVDTLDRYAMGSGSERNLTTSAFRVRNAAMNTMRTHIRQVKAVEPDYNHRLFCDSSSYGRTDFPERSVYPAGSVTMIDC